MASCLPIWIRCSLTCSSQNLICRASVFLHVVVQVYDRQTPLTAVELLNDWVLPVTPLATT
jgi:hypothetical protein